MQKYIITSFILFYILITTGCASKYPVTYNSIPSGASVICEGKGSENTYHGRTPITLYYKKVVKFGGVFVNNCWGKWNSGATKSFMRGWNYTTFPNSATTTIERPQGDGYESDLQFSLKAEELKYNERQTKAQERQAAALESANVQQGIKNMNDQINEMTPKTYNINVHHY